MAFRGGRRKDVKKQSYYVWFLGAKESKGLRGPEFIKPVLKYLLDRERQLEPTKVTLQVSNKGLKIIQSVARVGLTRNGKAEQIKHLIPHHAVTCVRQEEPPDDDIVSCILLIYNPVTRCPVHVHAYRCDSVETATSLRIQLQQLIDRPENQTKFKDIEGRLASKGLMNVGQNYIASQRQQPLHKAHHSTGSLHRLTGSDGRSTRTEDISDDAESDEKDNELERSDPRVTRLYDSLAAELKQKLNNRKSCPILLPPKDYDTVSRRHGNLRDIDNRRSTNRGLVGLTFPNTEKTTATRLESSSSGKSSSGIGSDDMNLNSSRATRHHELHPPSSSSASSDDDDDWEHGAGHIIGRSRRIDQFLRHSPLSRSHAAIVYATPNDVYDPPENEEDVYHPVPLCQSPYNNKNDKSRSRSSLPSTNGPIIRGSYPAPVMMSSPPPQNRFQIHHQHPTQQQLIQPAPGLRRHAMSSALQGAKPTPLRQMFNNFALGNVIRPKSPEFRPTSSGNADIRRKSMAERGYPVHTSADVHDPPPQFRTPRRDPANRHSYVEPRASRLTPF